MQFSNPYTYTTMGLGRVPPSTISYQSPASGTDASGLSSIKGSLGKSSGGIGSMFNPLAKGLGLASTIAGGISGLLAARDIKRLSKQVPQYARSQYPGQMIARAQMELNSNPFQAAQARGVQNRFANNIAASQRAVTDPSQMLSLIGAYSGASADEALKNDMANYAQRGQRLGDLYNAQNMGYAEDRNVYDNTMTAFNSKANLMNAANQTRTNAFMNMGGNLLAASNG